MDEVAKAQLVARFSSYLDGVDPTGDTDDGSGAESSPDPDLFTLFGELAALKNEVKLESRQVKSALDQTRSWFDALQDANARLGEEQERRREQERAADRRTQKGLLLELLELRDRLQAGHDQASRFRPPRFGGRAAGGFVASMAEGMAMNLRRLDETLARRDVHALTTLGRTFDPRTMHAAELAKDPAQGPGVVVGELRKGFLHQEELLRPAEVVVNRPDRSDPRQETADNQERAGRARTPVKLSY